MAEYMEESSPVILVEEMDETSYNPLDALREDISELKIPFDRVRHEIDSQLVKGSERMDATEKLYLAAVEMTKTLGEKYTNVSNEQNEWKDMKVKLAKTSLKGKVTLNVGGDRYTTSVGTLTREQDTFFTELFSQNWEDELDEVDKSIFIDRNGGTFTYILEYLRTDAVCDDVLQDEILRHNLMIEAKYFRLQNLVKMLSAVEKRITEEAERQPHEERRKKLNEFYGKSDQRWELIYKASRDGFDANAFHTRCNNQGPTMTIVQSSNNYFFGGYTAVAWTSDTSWKNDTTAFLFTLTNPHNIPPTKYLIKPGSAGTAVYHRNDCGPTFGSGHDLHLAPNSNSNNSSYIAFPNAYADTTRKGQNTFTGTRNFTASDIEVFRQV